MHGVVEMRPGVAVVEHSGGPSVWFGHTGTYYRSANRRLQLADGYYRAGRLVGSCLSPASLSGYPREMTKSSTYQHGWHSVQEGMRCAFRDQKEAPRQERGTPLTDAAQSLQWSVLLLKPRPSPTLRPLDDHRVQVHIGEQAGDRPSY